MEQLGAFLEGLTQSLGARPVFTALGATAGGALLALLLKPVRSFFTHRFEGIGTFFNAVARLRRLDTAIESNGIWRTDPVKKPATYADFFNDPLPILTVANLKGGVGKTTTATNLGAYFAAERGERVLLIDLDYQGSMSSMLLARNNRIPAGGSLCIASKLVRGDISASALTDYAKPVRHPPMQSALVIPAYYDLAAVENAVMINWLSAKTHEDARYRLAEILHSKEVRASFDRIIIDAPPRLTTGTIQALCASTHVLVPTVLDGLSGEAVGTFVREILEQRQRLWPNLRFAGISGQLVTANLSTWRDDNPESDDADEILLRLTTAEREGIASIKTAIDKLRQEFGPAMPPVRILPPETFIAKRAPIAESAGTSVAFLAVSDDLKAMFRKLGLEVATRMNPHGN